MPDDSEGARAGVLLVWCGRADLLRIPRSRNEELRLLAGGYHYLCPTDYAQLEIRELSEALDPRVVLKRCPKCRTTWHGPTLSELRSRPAGMSGPVDAK